MYVEPKPINILMYPDIHFDSKLEEPLVDRAQHTRLIGNAIYLIVTRPHITSVVGVLSRYMQRVHINFNRACISCL